MLHVWSGHVQSGLNLVHVPDSDMCKPMQKCITAQ